MLNVNFLRHPVPPTLSRVVIKLIYSSSIFFTLSTVLGSEDVRVNETPAVSLPTEQSSKPEYPAWYPLDTRGSFLLEMWVIKLSCAVSNNINQILKACYEKKF